MSYEATRQVIQGYFQARFLNPDTNEPWFDVEYPNHIISEPDALPDAPWGRFSIRHGEKVGTDVGTRSSRIPGEATLQIFLPEDSGVKLARTVADSVVDFMENVHLGTDDGIVRFRRISVRELVPENGWDQTLVVMTFERDVINPNAYAEGGDFIPYVPP